MALYAPGCKECLAPTPKSCDGVERKVGLCKLNPVDHP
jgi:hypothetical protein